MEASYSHPDYYTTRHFLNDTGEAVGTQSHFDRFTLDVPHMIVHVQLAGSDISQHSRVCRPVQVTFLMIGFSLLIWASDKLSVTHAHFTLSWLNCCKAFPYSTIRTALTGQQR